jgi:hypothetical protein
MPSPLPTVRIRSLTWAAARGDLELARELLDGGADIEEPLTIKTEKMAGAPLAVASGRGNYEMVTYLLERGAQIKPRATEQLLEHGCLTRAVQSGCHKTLKILLEHGAQAGIDTPQWMKPPELEAAAERKDRKAIEMLTEKFPYSPGNRLRAWAGAGATDMMLPILQNEMRGPKSFADVQEAMGQALQTGAHESVLVLLEHERFWLDDYIKAAALCALGQAEENSEMIKAQILDPLLSKRGLVEACAVFKQTETLRLLFEWGLKWKTKEENITVDQPAEMDQSLWKICKHASAEMLRLIHGHGADIHRVPQRNLLIPCAETGNTEAALYLLNEGVTLNTTTEIWSSRPPGRTWVRPPYVAASRGHIETTRALLTHKKDKKDGFLDDFVGLLVDIDDLADRRAEQVAAEILTHWPQEELQAMAKHDIVRREQARRAVAAVKAKTAGQKTGPILEI